MLKRCLLAVIVALLVTSSQIAAAEDYDWSQAPRISSKAEFYRYVEAGRRRGQDTFHVILANNSILPIHQDEHGKKFINKNDFVDTIPCCDYEPIHTYVDDKGMQLAFRIIEYPGTKVANVYLSRNQQQAWMELNQEEQDLFNIAVGIVDEANRLSSEREKAEYIHKAICDHGNDFRNENDRNKTAIGALIDGYANCQGFTDAFYMLGRMSGLNVGRIFGTADGGGHAWNWITFSNGKSYCVDLTLDKSYDSYEWFLANFEVMKRHHSCEWEIIPNLQ